MTTYTYNIYVTAKSVVGFDTKYLFPGSIPHVVSTTYEYTDDVHLLIGTVVNGHRPPSFPEKLGTHFEYSSGRFFGIESTANGRDLAGGTDYWVVQDRFDTSHAELGSVGISVQDQTYGSIDIPSFGAVTIDSMVSAIMSEGNTPSVHFDGSTGNDTLRGSFWDDKLDGKRGADVMIGGDGYDQYWIDNKGDKVVENANQGLDTINTKFSTTMPANIESLVGTGSADINFTGNSKANGLTGNSGNNFLKGLAGGDSLIGGPAHDTLQGGADNDTFWFTTSPTTGNWDTITDFSHAHDRIVLSQFIFPGVSTYPPTVALPGLLVSNKFWASTSGKAHDVDDRITYNTTNGKLYYDSNGNASGGSHQIAVLSHHPTLHASDILII